MTSRDSRTPPLQRSGSNHGSEVDLDVRSVPELLALYSNVLAELRTRGVIWTTNNPVADYSEWLVAKALGLKLEKAGVAGHYARDDQGVRYQIKGRRPTPHNTSRQLSIIRGLAGDGPQPFEYLVGVLFDFDFAVQRGAVIPIEVVPSHAVWTPHVNGRRFMLRDALWEQPFVPDITLELRSAA